MKKLDEETLRRKLDDLKDLPNIKEVRALRKRLADELNKIIRSEKKNEPSPQPAFVFNTPARQQGYQRVSGKLRRYHNFVKLQRENYFPHLSYREVQIRVKNAREKKDFGADTGIPEAYWQNPSP